MDDITEYLYKRIEKEYDKKKYFKNKFEEILKIATDLASKYRDEEAIKKILCLLTPTKEKGI